MAKKTFHMVAEVTGYVTADVEAESMDEAVAKMNAIVQDADLGDLKDPDWNAPSGQEDGGLPIFARVDTLTAQELLTAAGPYLDVKPNNGDVMSIKRFLDGVESNCLTNYDGHGLLMLDGKIVDGPSIDMEYASVRIGSELIVPLSVIDGLMGDRAAVLWFNR